MSLFKLLGEFHNDGVGTLSGFCQFISELARVETFALAIVKLAGGFPDARR
jgi:hypothetical protein